MTLETDLLLDRRRLKRRLFFWRGLAVLAVLLAILVGIGRSGAGFLPAARHVARLSVTGIITEDRKLAETVSGLADDDDVAALIVAVNSPGGSVAGGESLHDAIQRVAAKKPVVTVMGGTAASAGYMVAVPAARIFARDATLTGSIGVLLQTGEVSGLLGKLGVTAESITSGPLKDQPGFTHPLSAQGREVLHGLIMDLYDQFVGMVATGRHMEADRVRQLGDGRAYTGRQALALGLVDQIGDETDARAWLAQERQIPRTLPVTDVHPRGGWRERAFGASGVSGWVADAMARGVSAVIVGATQGSGGTPVARLDGAWAVWQP